MTHKLFGSSVLKPEADPATAHDEQRAQVGGTGTRWHGMKARFRPMFTNPELVEDWYNRQAPPKMKSTFRNVVKLLQSFPDNKIGKQNNSNVDPALWHRANHILRLYGRIFTDTAKDRVVAFLCHCSQSDSDMFGDAMNSLLSVYPTVTTTKSTWLPLDRLAESPDRTRFHKVIDWNSLTAAEKIRRGYVNPMDKKHLGLQEKEISKEEADQRLAHVPAQLKLGNKRTIGAMQALVESSRGVAKGRGSEDDPETLREIGQAATELTKKRKSHLELTGGRYEVDTKTGATLFQVKGQAASVPAVATQASMKERIVAAGGIPTHSWKSTAKDHFPNLSHGMTVGMGRVDPERHPCVARYTAATCMVVPSLQPKADQTVPSRGLRVG